MFETFIWLLGEEPLLKIDPTQPDKIIEMDVVGRSCMQYEYVVKPKQTSINVKVLTFEGEHNLRLKSDTYITVEDFVDVINNKMGEILDVKNNDIIVVQTFIQDCTIVMMTCLNPRRH